MPIPGKSNRNRNRAEVLDQQQEGMADQILAEREYYKNNPLAYFRDKLRVTDRDAPIGAPLIPLQLNTGQLFLHRTAQRARELLAEINVEERLKDPNAKLRGLHMVALKARKVGFSTYIQADFNHTCEFFPNTSCLVTAHKQDAAENVGQMNVRFIKNFPVTMPPIKSDMKRASLEVIEWHAEWDSRIIMQTAGAETSSARSYTFQKAHFSEEAWYTNPETISAAMNALAGSAEVWEESTANGRHGAFYESWTAALEVETAWKLWKNREPFPEGWNGKFRIFFPWWMDDGYTMVVLDHERDALERSLDETERALMERFSEITLERIKWRRWCINNKCSQQSKMEPEVYFQQEYPSSPEEAFVSQGRTAFAQTRLLIMLERAKAVKPKWFGNLVRQPGSETEWFLQSTRSIKGAQLIIYDTPKPEHEYCAGGDAIEGLEHSDDGSLNVFDRHFGDYLEQVARLESKDDPKVLGDKLAWLGEYFNWAWIMPEANTHGAAMTMQLMERGYPYVWHREELVAIGPNNHSKKFHPGFKTSWTTKPILVDEARWMLRDDLLLLWDVTTIEQFLIFENNNGRYAGPTGQKDDHVISSLLAIYGHRKGFPPVRRRRPVELSKEQKQPFDKMSSELMAAVEKKKARDRRKNHREERRRERMSKFKIFGPDRNVLS